MTSPEAQDHAVRLVRMKRLLDELERVCSDSTVQREAVKKMRHEVEAAHRALKPTASD